MFIRMETLPSMMLAEMAVCLSSSLSSELEPKSIFVTE